MPELTSLEQFVNSPDVDIEAPILLFNTKGSALNVNKLHLAFEALKGKTGVSIDLEEATVEFMLGEANILEGAIAQEGVQSRDTINNFIEKQGSCGFFKTAVLRTLDDPPGLPFERNFVKRLAAEGKSFYTFNKGTKSEQGPYLQAAASSVDPVLRLLGK